MPESLYKNTHKIFNDAPKFVVPIYQREYSWKPIQIDQLLSDIDFIDLTRNGNQIEPQTLHFLGLLVVIDEKNRDGQAIYSLVDGQQRLSTIILISAVAKDVITEILKNPDIKQSDSQVLNQIHSGFDEYIYKSSRPFGEKTPRLEPNNTDKDLFNLLVLEEGSLDEKQQRIVDELGEIYLRKNYFKAYQHIYKYILEKLETLGVKFMVDFFVRIDAGISFIPFVAESDTDAFNLFETLNDRGLNLSALDLIKNKVLQKANKNQIDEFDESWQEIFGKEGIIQNRQSQAFIRNFLMLKTGHISNNKVFDVCKSYLVDSKTTKDFLAELYVYSEFYRNITVVSGEEAGVNVNYIKDDEIAELLFLLNKTKVRQWQTVVLSLYKYYDDAEINKATMKEILSLLLSISIRFKILDKRFNVIEKKMPALAEILYKLEIEEEKEKRSVDLEEAIDFTKKELVELLEKNVPNEELHPVLEKGYLFDDNDLAFIVLRLIAGRQLKHGLTFSKTLRLSLEHVLPEKHEAFWGKIGSVDVLKYSIGNMLLVDLPENVKLSNKSFNDKKKQYAKLKPLDFVSKANLRYMKAKNQKAWVDRFIVDRQADLVSQLKDLI